MTPDDEAKRRRELERGQAAKRLLENPLWDEAWDVLHTNAMRQWRMSKAEQTAYREDLWRVVDVAAVVRKYVEQAATTGRAAEIQLERNAQNGD